MRQPPLPFPPLLFALILGCTGAAGDRSGPAGRGSEQPGDSGSAAPGGWTPPGPAVAVRVARGDSGWQLLRGGEPYFIRGAGGTGHLDELAAAGGNSLRTWGVDDGTRDLLDAAYERGLTVTVGLWLGHPEQGFDYRDERAVARQREAIRRHVMTLREHPALLLWGVGNEVELGTDDPVVWEAINDIARMIHAIDPNHPTLAVTSDLGAANERYLAELAPEIDLWGINSYGGLPSLPRRLDERGYGGPYLVTELAHYGTWEAPTTAWGTPLEPATAARSEAFVTGWQDSILADPERCLGGYAFYWQSAEHPTDTWYPLFTFEGRPMAPVDALTRVWTGTWPADRAPTVGGITLTSGADRARVAPGAPLEARLDVVEPEGEPVRVEWLLAPDALAPTGRWPRRCEPIVGETGPAVALTAPAQPGAWRLLAFAADPAGHTGYASLPFRVGGDERADDAAAALPMHVDDYYTPSGWMGDYSTLTRTDCEHPAGVCGGPCHRFAYTPGPQGWVGVVWQYPVDNWGEAPGLPVAPGASEVRFRAWAEEDGVRVGFFAGLRGPDGFSVESGDMTLSTEPTEYALSLEGEAYDDVAGAFGWSAAAGPDGEPLIIYVTDIVWAR